MVPGLGNGRRARRERTLLDFAECKGARRWVGTAAAQGGAGTSEIRRMLIGREIVAETA